jgi:hypothetical protein
MSKLESVLARLYAEERNIEICSFWDAGWSFKLGDHANGFTHGDGGYYTFDELADAIEKELVDACNCIKSLEVRLKAAEKICKAVSGYMTQLDCEGAEIADLLAAWRALKPSESGE